MTLDEVARYLAMAERTIYDWAQTGRLPAYKLGATWRFRRSEIDAWLQSHRSGPDPVQRRKEPLVPPAEVEPTRWQQVTRCRAEIEAAIADPNRTTFPVSRFEDDFGADTVDAALEQLRKEKRVVVTSVKGRDGERVKVIRRRS